MKNPFIPKKAIIEKINFLTDKEAHFVLKTEENGFKYKPGQFIEVGLFGFGEIPIGFASSPNRLPYFEIVVRKVGRVSGAIHKLKERDEIYFRGPLGNGFDVDFMKGKNILIVAGGIGLCPTRSLIQYILDNRKDFKDFVLFYGTKTPQEQLFQEDLSSWRILKEINFCETVDRPSPDWKGNVGVITTLFKKVPINPDSIVVICGPPIMYKFVMAELAGIGIPKKHVFVDLERRMKCGIGKCGHCQINDKYVCTDGPVFRFDQIEDLEEAL